MRPARVPRREQRVLGVGTGPHAGLVLLQFRALELALARRRFLVGIDGPTLRRCRDLRDQRMLRRQHQERRAEQRVGPRREHAHLRARQVVHVEVHLGTFTLADPLALHRLQRLGPVDLIEVLEQALGVLGDLQHPLAQRSPFARMVATFALAVDDLVVAEHGAERLAPPHRRVRLVGEAARVQLLPDPLRPAEVARVRGADLTIPVVREAEALQLALEDRDARGGRLRGMRVGLDRVLLRGQAERVPAHRMQHVAALGPLPARHDVGRRVALRVADVQTGRRRIGEHVERVELGLPAVEAGLAGVRRPEHLPLVPELLPLRFDGGGIVGLLRLGHRGLAFGRSSMPRRLGGLYAEVLE